MNPPEPLTPATGHGDLPEVPLTVNDLVGADPLLLGRLLWRPGPYRRPFLFLDVVCECGETHRCGWRWDWGLSADVVSYQALPCGLTAWLAIDPAFAQEAAEIHADAHLAYVEWNRERNRRKRHRKARNHAARKAALAAAEATENGSTGQTSPTAANASQGKPGDAKPKPPAQPAAPAPAPRPKRPAPAPTPARPVSIAARLAQRKSSALAAPPTGANGQPFTTEHPLEAQRVR